MDKDLWWRVRDEAARTAAAEAVEARDPGVFRLGKTNNNSPRVRTPPTYEVEGRMGGDVKQIG